MKCVHWGTCLLFVAVLSGCMPAPVPMPKNDSEKLKQEQADSQYKQSFMYFLGRTETLKTQYTKTLSLLKDTKGAGAKERMSTALKDYCHDLQDPVSRLKELKPPEKFREFNSLYVDYLQEQIDIGLLISDAISREDQKRTIELADRMESQESVWIGKIKDAVQRQGAHSMQEFIAQ